MRFNLIDVAKKEFPVHRLCTVLGVRQSGYFSWKSRPASRRQGEDMTLMAHIGSVPRSGFNFIGAAGVNGWPSTCMVEVEFGDFNPEPDGDPDDQIQPGPC